METEILFWWFPAYLRIWLTAPSNAEGLPHLQPFQEDQLSLQEDLLSKECALAGMVQLTFVFLCYPCYILTELR